MRITRIPRIKNHRIFGDFTWKPELHDFGQFNLIFGWNGSGKTTLSNLFRHLEKRQAVSEGEVHFQIENRIVMGATLESDSALPTVRVFNRDFILANIFSTQSEDILPIFFVGEGSIEKQKQIDELKRELAAMRSEYTAKQQALKGSVADLEAFCTQQARSIKELLSSSGTNSYNNYDKRAFKAKCDALLHEDPKAKLLSEDQKDELKQKKGGTPKDQLTAIRANFPDTNALTDEVSALLSKTVLSQVIGELAQDPTLAKWVREGLPLHVGGHETTTCKFCGQAMPPGRLASLQGHFNDQYNRFIAELETKIGILEALRKGMQITLPAKSAFYDHLAGSFEETARNITPQIRIFEAYLDALVSALRGKLSKPFEEVCLKELISHVQMPDKSEAMAYVDGVNNFVTQHNSETITFASGITSARKTLEECLVAEVSEFFGAKTAAIYSHEQGMKIIEEKGTRLGAQIRDLDREVTEHRRPADELNAELMSYLGRADLKFEVKENGYKILRDGLLAEHLSEGEKSAIAFLYFLKSLEAKDFDLKKDIVVIDDPVSSLDTNSLFCAFGYMKERTKDAGQLFVLTHNATFFRQVKNWFNHAKGQNSKDPAKRPSQFFMISALGETGRKRRASLMPLDSLLHKFESDYHYLFKQVHDHSKFEEGATELEQFYGLPNIARRLLEMFLAFRYPSQTGELRKQLDDVEFDPAKKARILRFLHTFSHDGKISEGEHDLSVLAETPQVLRDVLDLIESEDSRHFSEMKTLIAPPTPPPSPLPPGAPPPTQPPAPPA